MRLAVLLAAAVLCCAQDSRDAASLLSTAADRARAAKTWLIEGHLAVENGTGGESAGDFKLAWRAPGLARYEADSGRTLVVCDGGAIWTYFPRSNHYTKLALNKTAVGIGDAITVEGATVSRCGFFLADWLDLEGGLTSATVIGHDTVEIEGQPRKCELVLAEYPPDDRSRSGHRSRLLCIEPGTGLILRERVETNYPALRKSPAVYRIQTVTVSRITRDAELEASLFTFTPPEGSATNDNSTDDSHRVYALGEGVTPPVLLEKTDPQYPKKVVKAGIEGAVLLKIEVAPDGKAHNIQVIRSLDPDLDRKAVECVERWKFRPGTKDGQIVTVAASVEVNFRIER